MKSRCVEKAVVVSAWACGLLVCGAIVGLIGHLVIRGAGALGLETIFGQTSVLDAILLRQQVFNGLFPALAGTILLVCGAICLAVPVGLAAGIYLAEYSQGPVKTVLNLAFDILAGMPSIVIGLFGLCLTIILHRLFSARIYPCLLVSAISLAVLVLPYLIRTTQTALESLPRSTRLIAPALGASSLQNIRYVLLPACLPDIANGVILSLGRCAEDTAVIMLTGAVATAGVPRSVFDPYEALPFYIYYISAQYADRGELATGYGAALILLIICAVLFSGAFFVKGLLGRSAFGRL